MVKYVVEHEAIGANPADLHTGTGDTVIITGFMALPQVAVAKMNSEKYAAIGTCRNSKSFVYVLRNVYFNDQVTKVIYVPTNPQVDINVELTSFLKDAYDCTETKDGYLDYHGMRVEFPYDVLMILKDAGVTWEYSTLTPRELVKEFS